MAVNATSPSVSRAEVSPESKLMLGPGPLPRHIAIIMDGNGRWAEQRSLPRWQGHVEGAQSVRDVVTAARESGIKALTLYTFSVQNWERPQEEINHLMELLLEYLIDERETILDNGIRFCGIGQTHRLPERVRYRLRQLEQESAANHRMTLTLALSYGSREEIVETCRKVASDVQAGKLSLQDITEERLDRYMYTQQLPPLDLMIRTSGEVRLSNFMLWQAAYSEIVVTDVLWPDFRKADLFYCIEEYRKRQRRFGKTSAQVGLEQEV